MVINPRPPQWDAREEEICAQNALWTEQERLYIALALETDPTRQQEILAELDCTYQEVAERDWQTDWERRGAAVPDIVFADPPVPEHLRFRPQPLALKPRAEENQEQIELELELH
ncbi:hypothetical protein AB0H49_34060 [Nocardia sp. NPDC050713]|uniref:hypothetical protein n=1 Tax=Nocardia sp. NPDC050713 TaxID=3154511 RepID=UPI003407851D